MTAEPGSAPSDDTAAEIQRDAGDLRRSMRITLLSYILKFATPFLLILVIRLYGAEAYGLFAVVTAIVTVLMRVCLLGLDKGLLWWIPRQAAGQERLGLLAALTLVTITSVLVAIVTTVALAPVMADWAERPAAAASLRWMVAAILPMVWMEVLVQAAVARRRIEAHVVFKEGVVALTQVLLAIAFYFTRFAAIGLELAFAISYAVGLIGVCWVFRAAFRGIPWLGSWAMPPPALLRYSLETWLTELAAVAMSSLDVILLASFSDPRTVGLYRAGMQIAQNVLAVRWSFEPLIIAVVAEISIRRDLRRIAEGFSRTMIVLLTIQAPLVALLFAITGWIMPLLGPGFSDGTTASLVLAGIFLVHGSLGLCSSIIRGYGRTDLAIANSVTGLVACSIAGVLLIPSLGALGTSLALCSAYILINTLQLIQSRLIVGAWFFTRELLHFVLLVLGAGVAMALTWLALVTAVGSPGDAVDGRGALVRLGSFAVYGLVFGVGAWLLKRRQRVLAAVPT